MKNTPLPSIKTLLIIISLMVATMPSFATTTEYWKSSNEKNLNTIDHQPWQTILDRYLIANHPSGVNRFRYNEITSADKERLKNYLSNLQKIDPRPYKKTEQMAYWINLYNALTVDIILNYYPVESIKKTGKGFFSFGPWDDEVAHITNHSLTLNDIEHKILRPIWQDPRIHYAVNCASYACPNLSPKVFTSTNINTLLDQAAFDYINHTRGVNFDHGKLIVSSIYHWYSDDFEANNKMLIKHLALYAKPSLKQRLADYKGTIDHQYDWRLNEPSKNY